eukprot:GHRR01003716.1.p1 GENE.GHRR01003716.1~~GHRR01003716.1.p1  ORF type:complete len:211 (-),score=34.47 GHRR01003716.1:874-1506(-)
MQEQLACVQSHSLAHATGITRLQPTQIEPVCRQLQYVLTSHHDSMHALPSTHLHKHHAASLLHACCASVMGMQASIQQHHGLVTTQACSSNHPLILHRFVAQVSLSQRTAQWTNPIAALLPWPLNMLATAVYNGLNTIGYIAHCLYSFPPSNWSPGQQQATSRPSCNAANCHMAHHPKAQDGSITNWMMVLDHQTSAVCLAMHQYYWGVV